MAPLVLTGAGSGMGRDLADALHARGEELVLVARNGERARDFADRYPGSTTWVLDLARPLDVGARLAGQALPPRLEGLVHAAGVVELGAVADLDAAAWRRSLDVNLVAPAELTRLLLPALRAGRGQVVFLNSGSGLRAKPEWSAYAASKHGLKALADALRAEVEGDGVRVSSIYPGRVATPMQEAVHLHEGRDYDAGAWIQPASVTAAVLAVLDLPPDAEINDLSIRPTP